MNLEQNHILKDLNPQGLFHGILMTVGWVALQQIAIWSLLFRNKYRKAIYIHAAAMLMLTLLVAISATQIILIKGIQVIYKTWFHTLLGFIISSITPIAVALGFMARILQTSIKAHPNLVENSKLCHLISGWLLIAVSRILLYDQWIVKLPILFILLLIFDIISHIGYFYCKVYQVRMENISIPYERYLKKQKSWIRQIKNEIDLQVYNGDYFIFADYVYRLTPLLNSHPGGFQIVNEIRCRQVDRYLLGVQPLQKFDDILRISHTADSIRLAGQPIAKLQRAQLYPNIQQLNEAKIEAINFYHTSKRIYTVYLKEKDMSNKSFAYAGYSNLSQFGKYYAVTLVNKKTRLYTMVNFLHLNTIKLVQNITKDGIFSLAQKQALQIQGFGQENYFEPIHSWEFKQKQIQNYSIPLLIKKYNGGQVTSVLLRQQFNGNIKISAPRGRGLALQDILDSPKPYKIVMFSGGTGLYPFADIIDITFKELLIEKQILNDDQINLRNQILNNDPILHTKPFQDFLFTLYISVPSIGQIHPITLFQCQFLALHNKMRVFLKTKTLEDKKIINQRYPHIQINDTRYQKVLWHLKKQEISRIYICGPTRMTKYIVKQLQTLYWSPRKYLII